MKPKLIFILLSFIFSLDLFGASKFAIPATDKGLPGEGPIRRYQWFQNLWEKKRTGWATRVRQDMGSLVFLGDSITQGWGDDLKGMFVELSFPNHMQALADVAGHYTPQTLNAELDKINGREGIPLYVYHLKPSFFEQTRDEVLALNLKNAHLVELTDEFTF